MFYQYRIDEIEPAVDIIDRILVMAWVVSEITVDVCGMFFWSAIGLCLASILI